MTKRSVGGPVLVLAAALALAGAVHAQGTEPPQGTQPGTGTGMGMGMHHGHGAKGMGGGMHEQMMQDMQVRQQALEKLVAKMDDAEGPARVDAIAAVVRELVAARATRLQHMQSMWEAHQGRSTQGQGMMQGDGGQGGGMMQGDGGQGGGMMHGDDM